MNLAMILAAMAWAHAAAAGSAVSPADPAEKTPIRLVPLTRQDFTLLVPQGWTVKNMNLVKDPKACRLDCGFQLLSPEGTPVVDFTVSRHNFYAEAKTVRSHRGVVAIPDLGAYLAEYDCARIAPSGEAEKAVGGWVAPRVPWGGSCGKPLSQGKAPLGKIYVYEEYMWRDGLHYWRNKEVPMRTMRLLYDIKGWPGGIVGFSLTAERSDFDRYLPFLEKIADSFRLR